MSSNLNPNLAYVQQLQQQALHQGQQSQQQLQRSALNMNSAMNNFGGVQGGSVPGSLAANPNAAAAAAAMQQAAKMVTPGAPLGGQPRTSNANLQQLPIRAYLDQTVVPLLLDGM